MLTCPEQPEICRQNMKFQFQAVFIFSTFSCYTNSKNNKLIKKQEAKEEGEEL